MEVTTGISTERENSSTAEPSTLYWWHKVCLKMMDVIHYIPLTCLVCGGDAACKTDDTPTCTTSTKTKGHPSFRARSKAEECNAGRTEGPIGCRLHFSVSSEDVSMTASTSYGEGQSWDTFVFGFRLCLPACSHTSGAYPPY